MGIIDIILIALFLITVITSAARGFVRSITGILAWLLAGVLAIGFCTTVSETVYEAFLKEKVTVAIDERVNEFGDAAELVTITSGIIEEIPEFVINAASSVGIDTDILKEEAKTFSVDERGVVVSIEENIVAPVAQAALKAICFVLIFLLLSAILSVLLRPIAKIAKKLPLIKQVNTLLGGGLGILKAAVLVIVLSVVFRMISGFGDEDFSQLVAQSRIIKTVIESGISDALFI
ncbi:MAG: CvpA family protein [Clostridia bacterium]|nr:CvpA family protein [Clostridia bacterium]